MGVKPMSAPLESPEFRNLYVGDMNDDDAKVIESYVTPASDGPPSPHTEPIPDQGVIVRPTVLNRLLPGYLLVQPSWGQPSQIMPADEFRIQLMIKAIATVASPPANDGISFADNPNALTSPDGTLFPGLAGRLQPSDGWVNLGPYTGPLAVTAFGSTNPVTFTWATVTK